VASQNRGPTPGRGGLATPGERTARIARPLEASPRRDEEGSLGLEGPCGEPRDSARGSDPESIGGKVPTRRSARMEGPGLRTPNSTAALRDPPPRGREALPPDFLAVAQTASPPVVAHGRRFVSLETSSL